MHGQAANGCDCIHVQCLAQRCLRLQRQQTLMVLVAISVKELGHAEPPMGMHEPRLPPMRLQRSGSSPPRTHALFTHAHGSGWPCTWGADGAHVVLRGHVRGSAGHTCWEVHAHADMLLRATAHPARARRLAPATAGRRLLAPARARRLAPATTGRRLLAPARARWLAPSATGRRLLTPARARWLTSTATAGNLLHSSTLRGCQYMRSCACTGGIAVEEPI